LIEQSTLPIRRASTPTLMGSTRTSRPHIAGGPPRARPHHTRHARTPQERKWCLIGRGLPTAADRRRFKRQQRRRNAPASRHRSEALATSSTGALRAHADMRTAANRGSLETAATMAWLAIGFQSRVLVWRSRLTKNQVTRTPAKKNAAPIMSSLAFCWSHEEMTPDRKQGNEGEVPVHSAHNLRLRA
jgi:hypothetical protein